MQQDVLKRLDKAFDAFFRRVKNGETAGYPRFKSGDRYDSFTYPQSQGLLCLTGKCPGGDRYDSFTYPQSGYEIISNRLHLSKIGHVKIKLHRQIKGKIKTCTIKREGDQWFAIFATEYAFDPASVFHPSREAVGIDLGVKSFAVLSDGTAISNPRHSRHAEVQIQAAHQKIHRRKKGSHRRARAKKELSRLYRKVRHRRRDFLHQQSHKLARAYGTLVFEDLQITNLTARPKPKQDENGTYLPNGAAAKGGLNKSILDGGWRQFVTLCSYKAEEAGARLVKVPPKDTSQACSGCGRILKKELWERWHSCPDCGTELDRDYVEYTLFSLRRPQRSERGIPHNQSYDGIDSIPRNIDHNAARTLLHRYLKQKPNGAGSAPHKSRRAGTFRKWDCVEAPAFQAGGASLSIVVY